MTPHSTAKSRLTDVHETGSTPPSLHQGAWDYRSNGVRGVHCYWFSAAGMRSAKVMAKALRAGFQRFIQRCAPRPVGSRRSSGKGT